MIHENLWHDDGIGRWESGVRSQCTFSAIIDDEQTIFFLVFVIVVCVVGIPITTHVMLSNFNENITLFVIFNRDFL